MIISLVNYCLHATFLLATYPLSIGQSRARSREHPAKVEHLSLSSSNVTSNSPGSQACARGKKKLAGTRTLRAGWKNTTWKTISPKNKPGRNALFARCVYRHHTEMRSPILPVTRQTRLTSSATYRTNDRLLSNTPLFRDKLRTVRAESDVHANERRKLTKRSRHMLFFSFFFFFVFVNRKGLFASFG